MPLIAKIVSGSAKIDLYLKNSTSRGSGNETGVFVGLNFVNGRKPTIVRHCYLEDFRCP